MIERHTVIALLLALSICPPVLAQGARSQPPLRLGDSLLNLPTDRTLTAGTWDLRFTHRFAQPINEGDVHSFWGLDGAADIGIGLAYGYRPNLQFAVFRSDVLDDLELSAKYAAVRQSETFPLSVAARGGVNWKTERGLDRRLAPFVQVIVARQISPRIEIFATPTFSSRGIDYDSAFNVPLGAAWAIRPNLFLIAEVIPENSDAPGELHPGVAWAVGLKRAIGGHFFEVLLTDSRATHVDQYVASVPLGGIREGDVHLGFNIGRRFGGRR
jgi:hypothetical protein